MARLSIFNKRETHDPAAPASLPPGEPPAPSPTPSQPPLMLLTTDAAGPSVRRLHTFPDAESAAGYIQFWFPVSERRSIIAFWAMPHEPRTVPGARVPNDGAGSACAPGRAAVWPMADPAPPPESEVVVLIQHAQHEGSVYPFSFASMETALRFLREESARGLDLRGVRIYWAAFARIETSRDGEVTVTPQSPPPVQGAPEAEPEPAGEAGGHAAPELDPVAAYAPPAPRTTLRQVVSDLAEALHGGQALQVPREETRPAFTGFGSPPGRF